jgi:hypothetical protein
VAVKLAPGAPARHAECIPEVWKRRKEEGEGEHARARSAECTVLRRGRSMLRLDDSIGGVISYCEI